jgi:hypothetical protein
MNIEDVSSVMVRSPHTPRTGASFSNVRDAEKKDEDFQKGLSSERSLEEETRRRPRLNLFTSQASREEPRLQEKSAVREY